MQPRQEKIQTVKYAPPPPGVPAYGTRPSVEICFLGRSNYATALQAKRFIFGIENRDRLRHMYVVGKNGTGKSKFLELLVRQDIAHGHGLCFIDPQGEMIDDIANFIPESRLQDVALIDLTDTEYPVAVNPFFGMPGPLKHQYVDLLVGIFREYCGGLWTSEAEYVSRFIFLALLDYKDASFFGVLSMLTNAEYRKTVVAATDDVVVRSFWEKEFEEKRALFEERVTLPLKTKIGPFLFDPIARGIFSQSSDSFDFLEAIKSRKIVLIRLPKGAMADDAVAFVGALFMALIRVAAMTLRARGEAGTPFFLYIDEFQNLQTHFFEHLFSECTKANISITIAHRYIGQLSESVRTAIFGNVGNIVVFRVSGDDAVRLRPEMTPVFDAKDMMNLGTREFYIKMTIRGEMYDPFSGETLAVLLPRHASLREAIVMHSREQFAITRVASEEIFKKELARYSGEAL